MWSGCILWNFQVIHKNILKKERKENEGSGLLRSSPVPSVRARTLRRAQYLLRRRSTPRQSLFSPHLFPGAYLLAWSSQSSRNKSNCPPQFWTRIFFSAENTRARLLLPNKTREALGEESARKACQGWAFRMKVGEDWGAVPEGGREGGDISSRAWLRWVRSVMAEEDSRAGSSCLGRPGNSAGDATLSWLASFPPSSLKWGGGQPWPGPLLQGQSLPQFVYSRILLKQWEACLILLMDSKSSQVNNENQISQSPCLFLVTGSMRITSNRLADLLFKNVPTPTVGSRSAHALWPIGAPSKPDSLWAGKTGQLVGAWRANSGRRDSDWDGAKSLPFPGPSRLLRSSYFVTVFLHVF